MRKLGKRIMIGVLVIGAILLLTLGTYYTIDANSDSYVHQLHYIPEFIGMFLLGTLIFAMPQKWRRIMFIGLLLSMTGTLAYVYCSGQWLFIGFLAVTIALNISLVLGYDAARLMRRRK